MDVKLMDVKKIAAQVLRLDLELRDGPMSASGPWHTDSGRFEVDALYLELNRRLSPPPSTRKEVRIVADSEVVFRIDDTDRALASINVSQTGLCVRGELMRLKAGRQIQLVHVTHAGRGFDCNVPCTVVWLCLEGNGSDVFHDCGTPWGSAGLEFVRGHGAERPHVRSWYRNSYRTMLQRLAAGASV